MDWLLTDEFVEFSQKIAKIHAEKKELKQQIQEVYKELQTKLKILDDQAIALQEEFEKWKSSKQ